LIDRAVPTAFEGRPQARRHPNLTQVLRAAATTAAVGVLWAARTAPAAGPGCTSAGTEWALRVDNDFFAHQDEGYTSGLQLQAASPDLPPDGDEACLDPIGRWLQASFGAWLRPRGSGQANLLYGAQQSIYTPRVGASPWRAPTAAASSMGSDSGRSSAA
jgi:hypothetical protein